ncbi:pseudouridine synthase [Nibribacter ruber]|uniref:Pseudouridine synthase n=1 Tax=Nibribacter ruber TaxID=2698458 RepID=A0A6P1P123_9BACT|nr:pseudouridine synthase [Nibribacter ruber]QHL88188.1 pseudouridine synthase [Nibribacter ruber]
MARREDTPQEGRDRDRNAGNGERKVFGRGTRFDRPAGGDRDRGPRRDNNDSRSSDRGDRAERPQREHKDDYSGYEASSRRDDRERAPRRENDRRGGDFRPVERNNDRRSERPSFSGDRDRAPRREEDRGGFKRPGSSDRNERGGYARGGEDRNREGGFRKPGSSFGGDRDNRSSRGGDERRSFGSSEGRDDRRGGFRPTTGDDRRGGGDRDNRGFNRGGDRNREGGFTPTEGKKRYAPNPHPSRGAEGREDRPGRSAEGREERPRRNEDRPQRDDSRPKRAFEIDNPDRASKFSRSDRGDRPSFSRGGDRPSFQKRDDRRSNDRNDKPRTASRYDRSNEEVQDAPSYNLKHYEDRKKRKQQDTEDDGIRLNRYIANAGICSRREADELIAAGEIKVNGEVVIEMGYKVAPTDTVQYGRKTLNREKTVYVLLNKPKDFITTTEDPEGRKTVMDLVKNASKERLFPVGRLDRNTTGLLLFTNDGELAQKLTHPSHKVTKIYQVELDKPITKDDLAKIADGLELEDGKADVDDVALLGDSNKFLGIEIHIGRNRIVRRIFEHLGYEVVSLDRVQYAGLTKKDLPRGDWRFLSEKEVVRLKYFM